MRRFLARAATGVTLAFVLAVSVRAIAEDGAAKGKSDAASPPTKGESTWSRAGAPSSGPAAAIGGYSSGCVRGAVALPLASDHHRVMKPERGRHFGHPALVGFIDALGKAAADRGLGKLGVGDLGQARGGPAPNGHASHQNGLDVDLWFSAGKPDAEQESMVDLEAKVVNGAFGPRASSLLELSAKDPRVARIFVHASIKKRLCETAEGDRRWLGKLRPWYGHHEHFHVRLACPEGSPECQPQPPVPAGDDCDGVDWWLSDQTAADRDKGVSTYAKRIKDKPKLPASCDAVAGAPAAKPRAEN